MTGQEWVAFWSATPAIIMAAAALVGSVTALVAVVTHQHPPGPAPGGGGKPNGTG
jgi:hypothetical protein